MTCHLRLAPRLMGLSSSRETADCQAWFFFWMLSLFIVFYLFSWKRLSAKIDHRYVLVEIIVVVSVVVVAAAVAVVLESLLVVVVVVVV